MSFKPLDRMFDRIEAARSDSDTGLFLSLMIGGELLLKLVVSGLLAAVADDRERYRYALLRRLVRSDGLMEWSNVADEVLTGPPAQHLLPAAWEEQKELTKKHGEDSWQHQSVVLIHSCLRIAAPGQDELPPRVDARKWLSLFTLLRNKSPRGHGTQLSGICSEICGPLEKSLRLWADHFVLFRRPWAYLHRNLSGKYRVTRFSAGGAEAFDRLKTDGSINLPDGVYVHFDQPARVHLMDSTPDAADFYFSNGGFNHKRYELISYHTGATREADAAVYLAPAEQLPSSETQGSSTLDVQGNCFGNLPPLAPDYIHRLALEEEVYQRLNDEHHPLISLVGRGGIGKTSLALSVLHRLAGEDRFMAMLWFSARDIDLLPQGPKPVKPRVLTEEDIAQEFVRLMEPLEAREKGFKKVKYLADALTRSPWGEPLLFVFDNFETVRNPVELFGWIDTYLRPPNKALITTRFREFRGDYPVEVLGMTEPECDELVESRAKQLGINHLLTVSYKRDLYQESEGHPYVVKVLLGEVAKEKRPVKVARILATRDEILTALFERTYSALSPVAKRVFLTLASWRSTVPQLAIEAVLLRPANEKMDVQAAIEELSRSSMVESISGEDGEVLLNVPLVASIFAAKKLAVSPLKPAVEADAQILFAFGPGKKGDGRSGIAARVENLYRHLSSLLAEAAGGVDEHLPLLEFIAHRYPPAWLHLACLHEQSGSPEGLERAKQAVLRNLEAPVEEAAAQRLWSYLAELCRLTGDAAGEVHALVELCRLSRLPFEAVSAALRRLEELLSAAAVVPRPKPENGPARRVAEAMEVRLSEAGPEDCSRLARLFRRLGQEADAQRWTGFEERLASTRPPGSKEDQ